MRHTVRPASRRPPHTVHTRTPHPAHPRHVPRVTRVARLCAMCPVCYRAAQLSCCTAPGLFSARARPCATPRTAAQSCHSSHATHAPHTMLNVTTCHICETCALCFDTLARRVARALMREIEDVDESGGWTTVHQVRSGRTLFLVAPFGHPG
jgi:hypothetical protein